MNRSALGFSRLSQLFEKIRFCLLAMVLSLWVPALQARTQDVVNTYMDHWKDFYPSSAYAEGEKSAAWRFEDFSAQRVSDWLHLNHETEKSLLFTPDSAPLNERIDALVLLRQVRLELDHWEQDQPLSRQPQWYTDRVSEALTQVLVPGKLDPGETFRAVSARLEGVSSLCRLGVKKLRNGNPARVRDALASLERTISFYESGLLMQSEAWTPGGDSERFAQLLLEATGRMRDLATHIEDKVLPQASVPEKFGAAVYQQKLAIFSDNMVTAENLPVIALAEIDTVRELMLALADAWWNEVPREIEKPNGQALLDAALAAMEEDREDNRQDFLQVFRDATKASIEFVIQHELATVPENRNIIIDLLPSHSPFARIGSVFPPGPFDPDARTLLYLPSIPDDAPAAEKDGFYRSFNNHFNRMIIAHELWPGHDMQYKLGLSHASKVRGLFSNPYYAEGWASFVEVRMLEAGWGDGNRLTRLAHLRKRLENATRAYISVMVHTQGWSRERVIGFASKRGLLPAQFAQNLWKRVSDLYLSLQLTTYFVGYHGFDTLWREEQQRLGEDFVTRDFIDAVLATGAVPMTVLPEIVRQ